MTFSRRTVLTSAVAGVATLAAPRVIRAQGQSELRFIPHADLASLDPVWTTADITRNHGNMIYDLLYGLDADFQPHPQMVDGHRVDSDGLTWELTLRDGLRFHDGEKVLARDCVACILRWGKRDAFGSAMMSRTDEVSAPSDRVIRIRLKKPFALLPVALAQPNCVIMPERIARTDANVQISDPTGSGPFRFLTDERIQGSRSVYAKFDGYVPRPEGKTDFLAGPRIVHFDRVVWTFQPDPATSAAALGKGEFDWWENPPIDLVALAAEQQGAVRRCEEPHGRHRLHPVQSPVSAVRQSGDPAAGAIGGQPARLHGSLRRRRARTVSHRRRVVHAGHADGDRCGRRGDQGPH